MMTMEEGLKGLREWEVKNTTSKGFVLCNFCGGEGCIGCDVQREMWLLGTWKPLSEVPTKQPEPEYIQLELEWPEEVLN